MKPTSIDNAVTQNMALFTTLDKSLGDFSFNISARYDSTNISPDGAQRSNDYTGLNASVLSSYQINEANSLFLGFGQASRVPDARELYFQSAMGMEVGTPDLKQTTNTELDFGYEVSNELFNLKVKGFYSMLSDYIYYQKSLMKNNFVNIDATVYGAELAASVYASDDISIDTSLSYKKGEKSGALAGQSNTNLADIAPLRANLAVNYEYMNNSIATIEAQVSDKWSDFDADNGEQELDAWSIVNLKVEHSVNKNFIFTVGVNNLLDEAYAISNTYTDITLITSTSDDIMLLNEPGRYIYTNLTLKF